MSKSWSAMAATVMVAIAFPALLIPAVAVVVAIATHSASVRAERRQGVQRNAHMRYVRRFR